MSWPSGPGPISAVAPDDDAVATLRDATGGRGADVVLDFVGAEATIARGAAVSRFLGDVTVVGIAGGTFPFSFFSQPYEVSIQTTYWGSRPELLEDSTSRSGGTPADDHHGPAVGGR